MEFYVVKYTMFIGDTSFSKVHIHLEFSQATVSQVTVRGSLLTRIWQVKPCRGRPAWVETVAEEAKLGTAPDPPPLGQGWVRVR